MSKDVKGWVGGGVRGRLLISSEQLHPCPRHVFLQWEEGPTFLCTLPKLGREGAMRGSLMLLSFTFLVHLSLVARPHCFPSFAPCRSEAIVPHRGNGSELTLWSSCPWCHLGIHFLVFPHFPRVQACLFLCSLYPFSTHKITLDHTVFFGAEKAAQIDCCSAKANLGTKDSKRDQQIV